MENSRLEVLFQKYLAGVCSKQEYEELMTLINDPKNDERLLVLLHAAKTDLPDTTMASGKAKEIYQHILVSDSVSTDRKTFFKSPSVFLLAASALILLALGLFFNFRKPAERQLSVVIVTKITSDHQLIRLSDGSAVTLNKNSRIEYPRSFNGKTRDVTLIGEAYFDIHHDAAKPFLVHTKDITVTVLGTAFNINSNLKQVVVTVTRGKVAVSKRKQLVAMLTPNRQISISDQNIVAQVRAVNADQAIGWQKDDVYFDNVTMDSAIKTLENKFSTEIKFDSEAVKHCTLTGAFTHKENLQQILQVICALNNAKFENRADKAIHIRGTGCP